MALPKPKPIEDKSNDTAVQLGYISLTSYTTAELQIELIKSVESLTDIMQKFLSAIMSDSIKQDQQTESKNLVPKNISKETPGFSIPTSFSDLLDIAGITTTVLAIGAGITLLAEDTKKMVEDSVATIYQTKKYIIATIEKIPEIFSGLVSTIEKLLVKNPASLLKKLPELSTKFFDYLGDIAKGMDLAADDLRLVMDKLIDLDASVGSFFSKIGSITKGTLSFFSKFESIFSGLKTIFAPVIKILDGTISLMKSVLGPVMKGIGKLAVPLQILLSAMDFISGFISGYKKEGILEGIKEGLVNVYDGLVTSVVDLLLGIAEWILKIFGFDELAKELSTSVKGIFDPIRELFVDLLSFIKAAFELNPQKMWESLGSGYESLKDLAVAAIMFIPNLINGLIKDLFDIDLGKLTGDFIESTVTSLSNFFKIFVDDLSPEKLMSNLVKIIKMNPAELFLNSLSKLIDVILEVIPLPDDLKSGIKSAKDKIIGVVLDFIGGIRTWFATMAKDILSYIPGTDSIVEKIEASLKKETTQPIESKPIEKYTNSLQSLTNVSTTNTTAVNIDNRTYAPSTSKPTLFPVVIPSASRASISNPLK